MCSVKFQESSGETVLPVCLSPSRRLSQVFLSITLNQKIWSTRQHSKTWHWRSAKSRWQVVQLHGRTTDGINEEFERTDIRCEPYTNESLSFICLLRVAFLFCHIFDGIRFVFRFFKHYIYVHIHEYECNDIHQEKNNCLVKFWMPRFLCKCY